MPFLKTLEVPPVIIGFKFSSQKAAYSAELKKGEEFMTKMLPPSVTFTSFDLAPNQPFKSIVLDVGKMIPPMAQLQMKSAIAQMEPDQRSGGSFPGADHTPAGGDIRVHGDYFIITLGTDHAHLKFAANYASRCSRAPKWQSRQITQTNPSLDFRGRGRTACRFAAADPAHGILSGLKEEIGHMAAPGDLAKLEADLRRMMKKASAFSPAISPQWWAWTFRDNGLHGEAFGGLKPSAAAAALKFSGGPTATRSCGWMKSRTPHPASRCGYGSRTSFPPRMKTSSALRPPLWARSRGRNSRCSRKLQVPRIIEFYHISRDQFAKAWAGKRDGPGLERGDPRTANDPPPFSANGKAPRMAF